MFYHAPRLALARAGRNGRFLRRQAVTGYNQGSVSARTCCPCVCCCTRTS